MSHHTFKIKAGIDARDSSIEIDGRPLEGVRRVVFELAAGELTTLKLEVMGEVVVDGEFRESAILSVEQTNPDHRRES